jgi:hypothetical protein
MSSFSRKNVYGGEIENYFLFISENTDTISRMFHDIKEGFDSFRNELTTSPLTRDGYRKLSEKLQYIINLFVPEYYIISERLEICNRLIEKLKKCKPGRANWKNYEDTCIQIVRFLFVPPFKNVYEQSRTESGDTKRDAVLPNNQYDGFWQCLRQEFECKHVICEFKNYLTQASKDQLNQLRLYLSRPTIGRFVLLFIRKPPSRQLLEARRRAYEEHKILILILDDKVVEEMLRTSAFIRQSEHVLERLKISFELEY